MSLQNIVKTIENQNNKVKLNTTVKFPIQLTIEPREKQHFAYAKTKTQISEADQRLWFRYIDSTIPLLLVRASDSGSGDPGSILGRVGVFVSLSKRHLLPKKSTGNTQE